MCGLAGIFQYRGELSAPFGAELGLRLVDALAHRGPDDGGLLVDERILLGHRRLAILDLSERGHQPMTVPEASCWIAYNGEVYNFLSLRQELEAEGEQFVSHTDTEVILRGYLRWGKDVVRRLNGMFAFAIWDRRCDGLWLVRDPVGIKPLFFRDDGQRIWFGSEIKALLADPAIRREPDPEALDAFLTFGYVPAPRTGFLGIRQLQPGEWLWAGREGIELRRWYALPYPAAPPRGQAADAVERLDAALGEAVQRQLISDVPVGAMLSGGLDSSAIVRAICGRRGDQVDTFTVRFPEAAFDESPFAARIAEHYGTRHHAETVDASAAALLPTLVAQAEEPLADNSMIPMYLLARFVRQRVKVALSGDGADELLGGYDTYHASQFAPYYRGLPRWGRQWLAAGVHRLRPSAGKYAWANVLRRFVLAAEEPALRDHCSWRRYVSGALRSRLYSDWLLSASQSDPIGEYAAAVHDAPDWLSPFEQQLHIDFRFHLPNDMLVKVDRMSMAHALEVRVPWLDLEVLEACLNLPPQWKRQGGRGKVVLRRLLEGDLPANITRRRKAGFLVPLENWMRRDWQPFLRTHLTPEFASDSRLLRWPVLSEMLDDQAAGRADHAYPLFALLVLALWWRIWITGEISPARPKLDAAPTRITRIAVGPA